MNNDEETGPGVHIVQGTVYIVGNEIQPARTYTAETAIDGVEVDITIRGDEHRADTVLKDLRERLGRLAAAFDTQTPPDEIDAVPDEYTPSIGVSWDRVFKRDH